jgi:hypothetical protein
MVSKSTKQKRRRNREVLHFLNRLTARVLWAETGAPYAVRHRDFTVSKYETDLFLFRPMACKTEAIKTLAKVHAFVWENARSERGLWTPVGNVKVP